MNFGFLFRQLLSPILACELVNVSSLSTEILCYGRSTPMQVFDLLVQRFLEVPEVAGECLEPLLVKYGQLYKFHGERICMVFVGNFVVNVLHVCSLCIVHVQTCGFNPTFYMCPSH